MVQVLPENTPPTAYDVARVAKTSQAAVSRAFTPGASISKKMRERVLAAAAELGYRPNTIARSLVTRQSRMVGLAISNLDNPFFSASLAEFSLRLASAGFRLLLFTSAEPSGSETEASEVLQYQLEALIMLSTTLSSTLAEQCRSARIPVVLYNRTTASGVVSSVTGDNEVGARRIASFLLKGGHKRIAYLAGLASSSTNREREAGFRAELLDHGYDRLEMATGDFDYDTARQATRKMLATRSPPDAIFCANDHMAFAAIEVARYEFGLDIGREISIIGFDDVPTASRPEYSLTTYCQPLTQMVDETVAMISRLREDPMSAAHVVVPGELIIRGSARRPQATAGRQRRAIAKD